ncbi:MAG: hypothetical protein FWC50_07520 [Planctomycetaceae bacterium]|nr:hypothetical protein [Planctomycetaceae bacterium]
MKTEFVEGVVTLDGNPVPEGTTVTFSPVTTGKGEPALGRTDKDGHYTLTSATGAPEKGALAGDYKITVTKYDQTFFEKDDPKAPVDSYGNRQTSTSKLVLPVPYSEFRRTPLTYTVVEGKQTHNIELKSKP